MLTCFDPITRRGGSPTTSCQSDWRYPRPDGTETLAQEVIGFPSCRPPDGRGMSCKPRLAVPRPREQEGRRISWQVEPGGVGGAGGREWTSWRDQNLEDPVNFFGGVIVSYPVNFEE